MKRLLSFALPFTLALTLGAWAQSDTTPSPSSTNQATSPSSSSSTQSNTQNSTSTQANSATSGSTPHSSANTGNQTIVEGCIIRQHADYYLVPDNSGQPLELNSAQELSQHIGHHVRLQGSTNYTAGSSANNPSASAGTSQYGNSASNDTQNNRQFTVAEVQMLSETCPAGTQDQNMHGNNTSQSPR